MDGGALASPDFPRCRVIDLRTGKQLTFCFFADEATGEYGRYVRRNGNFVIDPETKRVATETGKTDLRIDILGLGEPYLLEPET